MSQKWGCIEILNDHKKKSVSFSILIKICNQKQPFSYVFFGWVSSAGGCACDPPRVTIVLVFYLWLLGFFKSKFETCFWIPNVQVCEVCLLCFILKLSHQALLVQGVNAELQGELERNAPNVPLSCSKKRPTAPRTPEVDCSCMIYAEEHLVYACKFCSPSRPATVPRRPVGSPVAIP